MKKYIIIILSMIVLFNIFSDEVIILKNRKKIAIYDNGTWEYLNKETIVTVENFIGDWTMENIFAPEAEDIKIMENGTIEGSIKEYILNKNEKKITFKSDNGDTIYLKYKFINKDVVYLYLTEENTEIYESFTKQIIKDAEEMNDIEKLFIDNFIKAFLVSPCIKLTRKN